MKRSCLTAALALAMVAGTGCGKLSSLTNTTGNTTDQAAVTSELATAVDLIDDGQMETSAVGLANFGNAPSGAVSLERPFRWWRTIDRIDRSFAFAFSDTDSTGRPTRADVTIDKTLHGSFNLIVGPVSQDSLASDSTRTVLHKPLLDHWTRHLLLVRVPADSSAGGHEALRWRIAGTSGVRVVSDQPPSGHAHIERVRIQCGTLDTTVTEPLAFFRLRDILPLVPGTEVTVTVTTDAADDFVVLMHGDHRYKLTANGDNTYTGHGLVPLGLGVRHFGVNAIARSTFVDDTAPYNSDAWIFPFVNHGELLADYR